MDIEEFRKRGYEAIDRICKYYKELDSVKGSMLNGLPVMLAS